MNDCAICSADVTKYNELQNSHNGGTMVGDELQDVGP